MKKHYRLNVKHLLIFIYMIFAFIILCYDAYNVIFKWATFTWLGIINDTFLLVGLIYSILYYEEKTKGVE